MTSQTKLRLPERLNALELGYLYQDCILRSEERREAYDVIATELCEYGLEWGGSHVDARAYRCRTDRLSIYSMRYGDEVTIRPNLYRDFLLAHVSLRKGIEIESDGAVAHVPEGSVFFSAPQRSIRLRWQENCEQLIVRIPFDLITTEERPPHLASAAMLPPALTRIFVNQLNMIMALAHQSPEDPGFSEWLIEQQTSLARFAAMQMFAGPDLTAKRPNEPLQTRDRRERLEAFIHERLALPILLHDLEQAAGFRRTQLARLTHETFDCSPMELVRRMRLQAARQALEANPEVDLTQLSLRFGFGHQGRFSQYYQEQFGELPRETRKRLRGETGKNG